MICIAENDMIGNDTIQNDIIMKSALENYTIANDMGEAKNDKMGNDTMRNNPLRKSQKEKKVNLLTFKIMARKSSSYMDILKIA